MKRLIMVLLSGTAIALYGCSPSTPGGPGTAMPESEKPMLGQTDNTFTLDVPMLPTSLQQGQRDTVSVGIARGNNFDQDVTLKFADVPAGVHIQPETPVIARTNDTVELTVHATDEAALGDFTIKVIGHPGTGADAMAELSLAISKPDKEPAMSASPETIAIENDAASIVVSAEKIESDADKLERNDLLKQMRADLDELQAKYEDLKERAAEAKDDTKVELDKKVATVKVKLDEAEDSLEEAKDAAPERWEKIKEGFKGAAKELKSMFK